jgi:hypothetical protein
MDKKRLIDADALRQTMESNLYWGLDSVGAILDTIDDALTVDAVEVVHGHWDDRENPQWKAYDIRHCSVCGWNIPKTKLRQKDSHWNYCPNCGAKMDGDGNG